MKDLIVFRVISHSYLGMLSLMNLVFVSSFFSFHSIIINFIIKDLDGKWGMRIESALSVRKVKVSFFFSFFFN